MRKEEVPFRLLHLNGFLLITAKRLLGQWRNRRKVENEQTKMGQSTSSCSRISPTVVNKRILCVSAGRAQQQSPVDEGGSGQRIPVAVLVLLPSVCVSESTKVAFITWILLGWTVDQLMVVNGMVRFRFTYIL